MEINEVFRLAQIEFLAMPCVQGVSRTERELIVYVESEADRAKIPPTFRGFPVIVKVVGRVEIL